MSIMLYIETPENGTKKIHNESMERSSAFITDLIKNKKIINTINIPIIVIAN